MHEEGRDGETHKERRGRRNAQGKGGRRNAQFSGHTDTQTNRGSYRGGAHLIEPFPNSSHGSKSLMTRSE